MKKDSYYQIDSKKVSTVLMAVLRNRHYWHNLISHTKHCMVAQADLETVKCFGVLITAGNSEPKRRPPSSRTPTSALENLDNFETLGSLWHIVERIPLLVFLPEGPQILERSPNNSKSIVSVFEAVDNHLVHLVILPVGVPVYPFIAPSQARLNPPHFIGNNDENDAYSPLSPQ